MNPNCPSICARCVPRMRHNIGIRCAIKDQHWVQFNANTAFAVEAEQFGTLTGAAPTYQLFVDARYDFDEVIAYLESL